MAKIITAHEKAGDLAHEHALYEDAAQHYQDALNVREILPNDRSRISEKLAYALSLGHNPQEAAPFFERALEKYIDEPAEAAKTVEILLQRARDLWRNARTLDAIPLLEQAVEVAEADGTRHLCVLAKSRMADYLIGLDRLAAAATLVDEVSEILDENDAMSNSIYNLQRGLLAAGRGNFTETVRYFDLATKLAQESTSDLASIPSIWSAYAISVLALGKIELSYALIERGMLFAREHHLVSVLSLLCLATANLLMLTGQYGAAHRRLLEAISYDLHMPRMDMALARIGTRIALHVKDEATVIRCVQPYVLEFAFRSGQPAIIADTAAAFAEWHYSCGRERQAQDLLHRAIEGLERLDWFWLAPITVARYGRESDIPKMRKVLERRLTLPCAEVASACLALFEAHVANRDRLDSETYEYARDAVRRFTLLGWHGCTDMAQALLPNLGDASTMVRERAPFADRLAALTIRERQIAELVFKKYTNREIADILAISGRTVEAHMTSILQRLGVRSRYQLEQLQ